MDFSFQNESGGTRHSSSELGSALDLHGLSLIYSSVENIPGVNARAAFTVNSAAVFRDDCDIMPSTFGNIKYMPWGLTTKCHTKSTTSCARQNAEHSGRERYRQSFVDKCGDGWIKLADIGKFCNTYGVTEIPYGHLVPTGGFLASKALVPQGTISLLPLNEESLSEL